MSDLPDADARIAKLTAAGRSSPEPLQAPRGTEGGVRAPSTSHFDPSPRPLEPAQNGFLYCEGCEKPQPATGHECVKVRCGRCGGSGSDPEHEGACGECGDIDTLAREYWRDDGNPLPDDFEGRAEFAESLLCAMAWSHAADLFDSRYLVRDYCIGECVFCDAAREGGR